MTEVDELLRQLPRPDLSVLGSSIRKIPPRLWEERMLFFGAEDRELKKITGSFPATFRKNKKTHPLFVLQAEPGLFCRVCPCSSRGSKRRQRYIKKGTTLEMTGYEMDRDSFLVERYPFMVTITTVVAKNLSFMGKVPESGIEGGG